MLFRSYLFDINFKNGTNITNIINKILDKVFNIFKKKSKLTVTHKRTVSDMDYNYNKKQENEKIDRILDKIKKSGYDSLSKDEKQQLFQAGKK